MAAFIAVAVFVLFWFGIARQLKKNGRGWFGRNIIACVGASFAFLLVVMMDISLSDPASQLAEKQAIREADELPKTQAQHDGPESTKGEMWEFVVNNAKRTAYTYAENYNPKAVLIAYEMQVDFIQQLDGDYEGRYLLKLVSEHEGDTSLTMLLPLFDEYASSENLDDEIELWQVVEAKFNDISFSADAPFVSESAKQVSNSPSFSFTLDEYFQRIEAAFKSKGLTYAMSERKHVSGSHADTVSATLGNFTAISLTLNKDTDQINSIILIGSGDGTEASGYEIMFTGAASQAAAAGINHFDDIILAAADMMKGEEKTIGSAKLSVMQNKDVGSWYISSPL